MKKKLLRRGLFMTGAAVMIMTTPAFAMVKSVELRIDTDSITDHDAGRAFLPPLEIEDEDEGMMELKIDTEELRDANPTIPYTVHFELHADDEIFDDDLKIRGTGIRQTYVDAVSVDNTQAWGRLLVYPFYRLPQPEEITVDYENRMVSWSEVPYAGDYEVVISYTKKNGDLKTVRKRTKHTSIGVGNEISASSTGTISVSLRALATEEEGYVTAKIINGVARWEAFSGAEKYRVCIQWNDSDGRLHKKEETTDKNWKDVSAYLNAVSKKNVTVKVRAIPRQNESKYYNIAVSEWAAAGDGAADTSDYDVDDVWEMMAEYEAVVDGNFAKLTKPSGEIGTEKESAWKQTGWKWQYMVDGEPAHDGWRQIDGSWYYFDADGFMHMGWLYDGGRWYYMESRAGSDCGKMIVGIRRINGKEYSFDASGACLTL